MPNLPPRIPPRPSTLLAALALAAAAQTGTARASECELNGESVSMYNGSTTAGKSGLVRCLESAGGPLRDERTMRDGKFIGPQRQYQNGVLCCASSASTSAATAKAWCASTPPRRGANPLAAGRDRARRPAHPASPASGRPTAS